MKSKSVDISDIGPIEALTIPIPEGGGIVVLQGPNGAGKTRALEAVQRLVTGKGVLDVRDRALGGKVSGLGAEIVVGKRTTARGTVEVHGLLGVDPSLLIEPGIKDPKARDQKRLEVVCHLCAADVPLERFGALLPGGLEELRSIAKATSLMPDVPLPVRASALKRDIQSFAREVEDQEKAERGRALGLREGLKGVDLDAPTNDVEIRETLEEAVRNLSRLQTRQEGARLAAKTANDNRGKVRTAKEEFKGLPVADAVERLDELAIQAENAEGLLKEAKAKYEDAMAAFKAAAAVHKESVIFANMLRGWEESIAAALHSGPGPTDEEIQAAKEAVEEARTAADRAAVIREAKARSAQADEAAEKSEELAARAKGLRKAADGCEGLLTEAIADIAPAGLRMKDERMVLETKRGETLYDDLSFGERSRIAVEIAAKAVGKEGLLVLQQEFFEGLDPKNARELDEIAKSIPCVILTARAADGELRAEVLA